MAVWLSLGWVFPDGYFPPGCFTPACACFAFCNRRALCHTPRGPTRCSPAPGLWDVPGELACRVPSSSETPSPRSGSPCVSGESAAPADILNGGTVAQYDFFDFRADRARSDSAGLHLGSLANPLSFSSDLPRALLFSLGHLHARQYPHLPVVSTSACSWGSGSRRRPPVLGNRRGAAPAPSVPRRRCARTPRPAPSLTMRPATLLSPDPGTIGSANRIPFLNRVLGVTARIYQGTSRILPRFTISRRRPSGWQPSSGSRSTAQNRFF